jgi:hypothetical protein
MSQVHVTPAKILMHSVVASSASRGGQFRVVVIPDNVVLLDAFFPPTQKTPILLLSPGKPACSFDWLLIDHDEDSGTA